MSNDQSPSMPTLEGTLTRAETGAVCEVLVKHKIEPELLARLPDWLLTREVLTAQLERDARLLTLLPDRLLTKDAVCAATQAKNFRLHMCPDRLLDDDVCEAYASAHATLEGVPRGMLKRGVILAAAESISKKGTLEKLSMFGGMISEMLDDPTLVDAVMERLLNTREKGENLLIHGPNRRGPFYDALWQYMVSHDTPGSRVVLGECLKRECYFQMGDFFKKLAVELDYARVIELMDHSDGIESWLHWKMLIAMGELHPSKIVGYLSVNLPDMERYLETSGDRLGPELTAAMTEILECKHAL